MGGHHGRGGYYGDRRHGHASGHAAPDCGPTQPPQTSPPPTLACSQCSAPNPLNSRFCQNCGTSLQPEPCQRCRAPMASRARFCAECGQERST
ncbi:MAG: zinc ribbon domain-containing protein [Pseudomonas sp.]